MITRSIQLYDYSLRALRAQTLLASTAEQEGRALLLPQVLGLVAQEGQVSLVLMGIAHLRSLGCVYDLPARAPATVRVSQSS